MQPLILAYQGKTPRIHESAWIAPNATIIGDVEIGPDSSVFYGCVLRGDVAPIRIGARTNIQDNCTVHVDGDAPCTLGDDVTVGHMALLHGTTVGNGTLVGMKSALLSHSVIGPGALIAAGAVVLEHQEVPERSLAAGVPAKVRRELSAEQSAAFIPHAAKYVETAQNQSGITLALADVTVRNGSA
ncbi:gamma carbonic anhydrase family protein [Corynebacterium canis]|uniref:Gamma carbonic anhydrase family protein n=1 Tax=Corynebacterium canis TaxID=679663 RepID=A0A5C5TZ32_9CORY|nr:gamma carbonic anhydrase family protein [Corynebacterium canis]TWT19026.1 gamma carbonic anhydrase family protein [Corynebacterium canis]WJY73914.1 UDP-3-O-[3-hydroxymyristoyl] glucosamine N-acyltransferase [Corynebacterium canis]